MPLPCVAYRFLFVLSQGSHWTRKIPKPSLSLHVSIVLHTLLIFVKSTYLSPQSWFSWVGNMFLHCVTKIKFANEQICISNKCIKTAYFLLVACNVLSWLFLDVFPLLFSSVLQSSKFLSKRTSCSVATEPPPAGTEEPEMDLPKEIFLKDYKKPDYLFDTVTRLFGRISICTSIFGKFQQPWHMVGCD